MIDPTAVTDLARTDAQLEEFLLFAILVAGKKARIEAPKLAGFLSGHPRPLAYVDALRRSGTLGAVVLKHRLAPYNRVIPAFAALARLVCTGKLDLRTASVPELESLPGIGPKTARFFVQHSRGARVATLDTHILRWLREQGHPAPKQTPPEPKRYARLEAAFLAAADRAGLPPHVLDLAIWRHYAERRTGSPPFFGVARV